MICDVYVLNVCEHTSCHIQGISLALRSTQQPPKGRQAQTLTRNTNMDVAKILRMTRKGTAMNATASTRGDLRNGMAPRLQKGRSTLLMKLSC